MKQRLSLREAVKQLDQCKSQIVRWKKLADELVAQRMAMESALKLYAAIGFIVGIGVGFAGGIFI